ncbi:hypothetical protein BDN70DRAFT_879212 [Pholiota conissans]|uniref:Uncharacterized protein n=1 Tax=Pholiota conissans TaxID=109636 RepID=A0A9P5Z2R1_9AGAR|nr:hypothetical protein BDN70DRAFT_879212 [Pholiota conissans]
MQLRSVCLPHDGCYAALSLLCSQSWPDMWPFKVFERLSKCAYMRVRKPLWLFNGYFGGLECHKFVVKGKEEVLR